MVLTGWVERMLLHDEGMNTLIPGSVNAVCLASIRAATEEELCSPGSPVRRTELVRAIFFYYHSSLDEAHRIVQDSSGDLAAYLHRMIHRREADFENARYWFRRAGVLPFYGELHRRASLISEDAARQLDWDPFLFTTLCERFRHKARHPLKTLLALQRAECMALLEYVARAG